MDKDDKDIAPAWDAFVRTGKVEAYLRYKAIRRRLRDGNEP